MRFYHFLLFVLLSACASAPSTTKTALTEQCIGDCVTLAQGLLEVGESKPALALANAYTPGGADTPVRDFQMALIALVASKQLDAVTEVNWEEFERALALLAETGGADDFASARTDFLPKSERIWLKAELIARKTPYSGLAVAGWSETINIYFADLRKASPTAVDVYIASRSSGVVNMSYSDMVSRFIDGAGQDGIRFVMSSASVSQPLFDLANRERAPLLKKLVAGAQPADFTSKLHPIPGGDLPALEGCELVEPLLEAVVRSNWDAPDRLTDTAECYVRLGYGERAGAILTYQLSKDPENERLLKLAVLNGLVSDWYVAGLSDKCKAAGRQDLVEVLSLARSRDFAAFETGLGKLETSIFGDILATWYRSYTLDFKGAMEFSSGLLHEFRSRRLLEIWFEAARFVDVQNVPDRYANAYAALGPNPERRHNNSHAAFSGSEHALAWLKHVDSKEATCEQKLSAFWLAAIADQKSIQSLFKAHLDSMTPNGGGVCQAELWKFGAAHIDDYEALLDARLGDFDEEKRRRADSEGVCRTETERSYQKAHDADPSDLDIANKLVWCRVRTLRSTPDLEYALSSSDKWSHQDSAGWSLLLKGRLDAAAKLFAPIAKQWWMYRFGLWVSTVDSTSDSDTKTRWWTISGQFRLSEGKNLPLYIIYADALAAAGHDEQAREVFEFLTLFGRWSEGIPDLERRCPTCRDTFRDVYGHERRVWVPRR